MTRDARYRCDRAAPVSRADRYRGAVAPLRPGPATFGFEGPLSRPRAAIGHDALGFCAVAGSRRGTEALGSRMGLGRSAALIQIGCTEAIVCRWVNKGL